MITKNIKVRKILYFYSGNKILTFNVYMTKKMYLCDIKIKDIYNLVRGGNTCQV